MDRIRQVPSDEPSIIRRVERAACFPHFVSTLGPGDLYLLFVVVWFSNDKEEVIPRMHKFDKYRGKPFQSYDPMSVCSRLGELQFR
jgi:hypothetical protein